MKTLLPFWIVACLFLAGCSTGIGRAASQAFSGTPPEIAASLDSIETAYNGKAAYVEADVLASDPKTPDGQARKETARAGLESEHAAILALLSDLRAYLGVTKGSPEASQAAAQKRWNDAVAAALTRIFPATKSATGGP